jgi:hypothetical protein
MQNDNKLISQYIIFHYFTSCLHRHVRFICQQTTLYWYHPGDLGYCSHCSDWTMGCTIWGSNPSRHKRFSLLWNIQKGSRTYPAYYQWAPGSCPQW